MVANRNQVTLTLGRNNYPRDGGAWWAAIYGVAQSRTQLKRLSSSSNSMESWAHKLRNSRILVCSLSSGRNKEAAYYFLEI